MQQQEKFFKILADLFLIILLKSSIGNSYYTINFAQKFPFVKKDRFNEMKETGSLMEAEARKLDALLQKMRLFDDNGQLEKYCLEYLHEKVTKTPLRAYYSRKLYEYLSEYQEYSDAFKADPDAQDLFLRKLPFVFEVVITIQYLHNHILDEKYDTKKNNHPKIIQNLLSSNVLRELLFLYLEEEITPHLRHYECGDVVAKNIHRLLLWVDIGQYLDKEYNNYHCWKKDLPKLVSPVPFFDDIVHRAIDETMNKVKSDVPDKDMFIDAYFRRIYLSNVYFFRCMTETVMALGNYQGQQYQPLLIFSTQYGFMLQIINDYSDFAYTEDKKEQKNLKTVGKKTTDLLADLNNFNVTLPLIYHLKHGF